MILDEIVSQKKCEVNKLKTVNNSLKAELKKDKLTLIAEIKKASPSKGVIAKNFNPIKQLKKYEQGGASSISVLTDKTYFKGSKKIFKKVRSATDLPLLRKEFIIDPVQIYESLIIGADVILLIAAILSEKKLKKLLNLTKKLNLEAIVEIHSIKDLKKAINTSADILGINNRNLTNFNVNLKTTVEMIKKLQKWKSKTDYNIISESGIKDKKDIDYLREEGVDGVLIGETLMKAENPELKIQEFLQE